MVFFSDFFTQNPCTYHFPKLISDWIFGSFILSIHLNKSGFCLIDWGDDEGKTMDFDLDFVFVGIVHGEIHGGEE